MKGLRRRLQILITDQHYNLLESLALQANCSMSELIRRAIEEIYQPHSSSRSLLALKRLQKKTMKQNSLLTTKQWEQIVAQKRTKV